jgi:hypothetical protein
VKPGVNAKKLSRGSSVEQNDFDAPGIGSYFIRRLLAGNGLTIPCAVSPLRASHEVD